MTKKDFELIAKIILQECYFVSEDANHTRTLIAGRFAKELARTNPRFNRDKFITACTKHTVDPNFNKMSEFLRDD